jgi:hypothetical protein
MCPGAIIYRTNIGQDQQDEREGEWTYLSQNHLNRLHHTPTQITEPGEKPDQVQKNRSI